MKISQLIEQTPPPQTVSTAIAFSIAVLDGACYNLTAESRASYRNRSHLQNAKLILYEMLTEHERGNLDL